MLDVERWAEIRRMHFIEGLSLREIARRTGRDRKTVRRAVRASEAPSYARPRRSSKLDPFKDEIHRLLRADPRLPGVRIREFVEPLGFTGGQTIVDSYLREVRPLFLPARTFQRTTYRPGEILQFDLFHPRREIPVGHGQTRQGYVLVAALGYSRAGAGALVFSKQAPDLLWALGRCLERLGGLPKLLVTDREGSLHRGGGRPTEDFARFCGELRVGWRICREGDPQAKGSSKTVSASCARALSPAARSPTSSTSRTGSTAGSTSAPTRCAVGRSIDSPKSKRRWPPYPPPCPTPTAASSRASRRTPTSALIPATTRSSRGSSGAGWRVRISEREVRAVALDTGELAAAHERSFARHRTITALDHARALRERRGEPRREPDVELRPLSRYDALIPA